MQHIRLTTAIGNTLLVPLGSLASCGAILGTETGTILLLGIKSYDVIETPHTILSLIEAASINVQHGTAPDIRRLANAADFLVKMIRDINSGNVNHARGAVDEMAEFGNFQDLTLLAETAGRYLTRPAPRP